MNELPKIERVREGVRNPGQIHRLILVHAEEYTTVTRGTRCQRCTFVTDNTIIYGYLVHPEENIVASFVWDSVLEHPKKAEVGMVFYAKVYQYDWKDQTRNRINKLFATRLDAELYRKN